MAPVFPVREMLPNQQEQDQDVVFVMVPLPIQGHMNQLLHLSRLLLSSSANISAVHFVGSATHLRQARLRLHGWNPAQLSSSPPPPLSSSPPAPPSTLPTPPSSNSNNRIHFHELQIPNFPTLSPKPNSLTNFPSHLQPLFDATFHLRKPVRKLLRLLASQARKLIVINDSLMGYVIQDAVSIPNAESYTFHSVSAFACSLFMWESMGKPINTNGIIPKDVPSNEGCFTSAFKEFVAFQYRYKAFSHGTIYDSCKVIEGPYFELVRKLEEKIWKNRNHWALGPFNPVKAVSENQKRHSCLEWLDKQERNAVVYVSFGSTTSISDEQIGEIAIGLKQSNQKFIWVLREADKGDDFDENRTGKPELPNRYEDSVKENGIVVRDWAPQLEILAHESTGGFISHCGWNSCMESITMGVPIGAWPMHSDQPRNAVLVTETLKIGVWVREWERRGEIVTAAEVELAVRRLMGSLEGVGMRKRAAELGCRVRDAVEEGGVSRLELESFLAHVTR